MTAFIWKNRVLWLVGIVVSMLFFDQVTKIAAQDALTEVREMVRKDKDGGEPVMEQRHVAVRTIEVIPSIFNLKYAENRAAAFSLTSSVPEPMRRPMLLSISLIACLVMAVWYLRIKTPDALLMTCFAFIIGGALGNLLDRARLAYVIDFLDFYVAFDPLRSWLDAEHTVPLLGTRVRLSSHWPTFNVADMCIVGGALGVLLRTVRPLATDDTTAATNIPAATTQVEA